MDRYSRFTILITRISRSIHRIKDDAMCDDDRKVLYESLEKISQTLQNVCDE